MSRVIKYMVIQSGLIITKVCVCVRARVDYSPPDAPPSPLQQWCSGDGGASGGAAIHTTSGARLLCLSGRVTVN